MSLNVLSRNEILNVDIFNSAFTHYSLKENYSIIIAEYLYGLIVKSSILKPLTKCLIHHACVVNS
jgi:hypothetical protein